jgi:hypothetical protein
VTHEHDVAAHAARVVTVHDGRIASDEQSSRDSEGNESGAALRVAAQQGA